MDLKDIQKRVPEVWPDSDYPATFGGARDLLPHIDAAHSLMHATKAVGKVAAAIEPADHGKPIEREALGWALADVIITAARIANKVPGKSMDLDALVTERLEQIKSS